MKDRLEEFLTKSVDRGEKLLKEFNKNQREQIADKFGVERSVLDPILDKLNSQGVKFKKGKFLVNGKEQEINSFKELKSLQSVSKTDKKRKLDRTGRGAVIEDPGNKLVLDLGHKKVYEITTASAAVDASKGTGWCIGGDFSTYPNKFGEYQQNNIKLFVVIDEGLLQREIESRGRAKLGKLACGYYPVQFTEPYANWLSMAANAPDKTGRQYNIDVKLRDDENRVRQVLRPGSNMWWMCDAYDDGEPYNLKDGLWFAQRSHDTGGQWKADILYNEIPLFIQKYLNVSAGAFR
jgi:hypothetical protein